MAELHEPAPGVASWDTKARCTCGHSAVSWCEMWKHQADALREQLRACQVPAETQEDEPSQAARNAHNIAVARRLDR